MKPGQHRLGRKPADHAGFTLVELQIALLLMAMITLLMIGALRMTVQTWERNTNRQDVEEHRFLVDQFLRKHLNSMRFPISKTTEGNVFSSFAADDFQLHFIAPFPSYETNGEIYWWTLKNEWNSESERLDLILEYFPRKPDSMVEYEKGRGLRAEDTQHSRLLVAEATELVSMDFYREDELGVSAWTRSWEPGLDVPQAIKMELVETQAEGKEVEYIEIAIVPRFARQFMAGEKDEY